MLVSGIHLHRRSLSRFMHHRRSSFENLQIDHHLFQSTHQEYSIPYCEFLNYINALKAIMIYSKIYSKTCSKTSQLHNHFLCFFLSICIIDIVFVIYFFDVSDCFSCPFLQVRKLNYLNIVTNDPSFQGCPGHDRHTLGEAGKRSTPTRTRT